MKKISIVVPTFNEELNVIPLSEAITREMADTLPEYDYEIIFIDNDSKDNTRPELRELCAKNPRIRAIFNAKNFGQFNSPVYGMTQAYGDAVILMCADFQDPVEMIPKFVHEWEKGYQVVAGQKTSSQENKLMYFMRGQYYKILHKYSEVEQIEQFTGFGIYDQSFIEVLRNLHDPTPFLRGIVAEFASSVKTIPYDQPRRRAGKTSNNFYRLYDAAMLSFTSYTKIGLRLATFIGFFFAVLSFLIALAYLILKLIYWDRFSAGTAPILIGIFLLGSLQLIFIGLIGEYVLSINQRVINRPLVIEKERINFGTPGRAEGTGRPAAENSENGAPDRRGNGASLPEPEKNRKGGEGR